MGLDMTFYTVDKTGDTQIIADGGGHRYWDFFMFPGAEHDPNDKYGMVHLYDQQSVKQMIQALKMAKVGVRHDLIERKILKPIDKQEQFQDFHDLAEHEYLYRSNEDEITPIITALENIDWSTTDKLKVDGSA